MLISAERTRTPRPARTEVRARTSTPRGRSLVFVVPVLLALAAIGVLMQSRSSGAALFTALLVNAAAAPLAHATRLGARAPQPSRGS